MTGARLPAAAAVVLVLAVLAACGAPPPPGPTGPTSTVVPGPTGGGIYRTVTGSEHSDPGRSRAFPDAVFGGSPTEPDRNTVVVRTTPQRYPGPYNLVTREADELFVYSGSYGGVEGATGPVVARLDPRTLEEVWRTTVSVVEPGGWNYPGALGVHGNGDLYVVAANAITRLDPETGAIRASTALPTTDPGDSTYNGYTTTSDGTIVTKAVYRTDGCTEEGGAALLRCPDRQRTAVLVAVDPETLAVLDEEPLPEPAFSRLPSGTVGGVDHVYVTGIDRLFRYTWSDGRLRADDGWGPVDVLTAGQDGVLAPVITQDRAVFQTNGAPSTAPMSVWAVSLADAQRRSSLDPFAADTDGESLQIAAMVVDPVTGRVFPNDLLAGRLAALDVDPAGGLRPVWAAEQTSFSFGALLGGRVLVMTDLSGVLAGINPLAARSEQVVFRDAETGAELARTGDLPRMSGGANLAPGFAGQVYYPAADGTIHELTVVADP